MTKIYIGTASKLAGMDRRTFRKYVEKGIFKVVEKDLNGFNVFSKEQVLKVSKSVQKDRKRGYPLIVSVKQKQVKS